MISRLPTQHSLLLHPDEDLTQCFAQKELEFPKMEMSSKFCILGVMSLLEKKIITSWTRHTKVVEPHLCPPPPCLHMFHLAVAWDRILLCSQRTLELTMEPRLLCNLHHPPLAFLLAESVCTTTPNLVFFYKEKWVYIYLRYWVIDINRMSFFFREAFSSNTSGLYFLRFILCKCCLHVCSCTICGKRKLDLLELGFLVLVS